MAGRTGNRTYRRNRATVLSNNNICHLCGFEIDLELKFPDLMSATVDHIVPHSLGGDDSVDNLRPSHLDCNRRRYNKELSRMDIRKTGGVSW